MSFSKIFFSAMIVFGASLAGPRAQTFTAPTAVSTLGEQEIRDGIVGHSLKGTGSPWLEYYDPQGRIRGLREGREHYSGRWMVDGPVFCRIYASKATQNGCWTLALEDNEVRFFDKSTGRLDGSVALHLSGNPKGL